MKLRTRRATKDPGLGSKEKLYCVDCETRHRVRRDEFKESCDECGSMLHESKHIVQLFQRLLDRPDIEFEVADAVLARYERFHSLILDLQYQSVTQVDLKNQLKIREEAKEMIEEEMNAWLEQY
ncbi:hypothetical protein [Natrinema altunense]|uniref:Uncharacterized protein n=1 Tax=Natrinema altunense (strain JCM 12890 / CGMCC 1.3731 / AJ2) TaxID=1227494 RepID=L9ZC86_NATA2|nr:hypothetical protein [Natrinema altunense]ELY83621.1 hypothetical protein C485_17752 [Natrinema altunense JCM 12890]